MKIKVGIGQDSHRFGSGKVLRLGGLEIPGAPGLVGNSDADVILHALCNAISGVTGVPILGARTDAMAAKGVTDSAAYVREALRTLDGYRVCHVSVTLEARSPKLAHHLQDIRTRIAEIVGLSTDDVGVTVTSGEGLTTFGQGEGIQAFVAVTVESH